MSALDLIATARDATFAARIGMISMKVAVAVANEGEDAPDHAERLFFAGKVLRGEMNNKVLAAAVIASNGTIAATIEGDPNGRGASVPDGDLEFAMASVVTAIGRAEAP